ncbi:Dna polymerase epsilon subunit B protein [Cardiosporidium cionae]|uniref:DNA polymerase II subunit 2 n=1 Tax=Cardiosporidium cionae TaxID=476202 RepID=A0ABQ7JB58_9APIC|nr:Dna polymerase epsilon subunit B protein [Cardiosporidium cionae]|eukprot:KAF8821232.1 Dna polymerase epsilon subunit B protein [Cardiosporidium cionae]
MASSNSLKLHQFISSPPPFDKGRDSAILARQLIVEKFGEAGLDIEEEAVDALLSNLMILSTQKDENAATVSQQSSAWNGETQMDLEMMNSIVENLKAFRQATAFSPNPISCELIFSAIDSHFEKKRKTRLLPFTERFGQGISLYDAFRDVFDIYFDEYKQKFVMDTPAVFPLEELGGHLTTAQGSASLYNRRYEQLIQRTKSHPQIIFSTEVAIGLPIESKTIVSTIEGLRRTTKVKQHLIGILNRNKDGLIGLQGSRNDIQIRFADSCHFNDGIYCDGHIVLVQGMIEETQKCFLVSEMMHPPRDAKADHGSKDYFGGILTDLELSKLRDYEWQIRIEYDTFSPHWVIINEIHLDCTKDLNLLERLLDVYQFHTVDEQSLPTGFIFMGNFSSSPFTHYSKQDYQKGFDELFSLLSEKFESLLSQCYFIFIPGPNDGCFSRASSPRFPILPVNTNHFKEKLEEAFPKCRGKIVFATNPCRIRHLTHRMIFFRNDVFNDLIWDSIKTGGMDEEDSTILSKMLSATLIGQAHLYPVKSDHRLIKKFDSCFRLWPLPDLICLGDTSAPFFIETATPGLSSDSIICNADASFSKSEAFLAYDVFNSTMKRYKIPSVSPELP